MFAWASNPGCALQGLGRTIAKVSALPRPASVGNQWAPDSRGNQTPEGENMITGLIGVLVAVAIVLVLLKVALLGGILGLVALVLLVLLVLGRI
jgi:hypothetical protein